MWWLRSRVLFVLVLVFTSIVVHYAEIFPYRRCRNSRLMGFVTPCQTPQRRRVAVAVAVDSSRRVCVLNNNVSTIAVAQEIAERLSIPLLEAVEDDYTHALVVVPGEDKTHAVGIQSLLLDSKKKKTKPFVIDFCSTKRTGTDLLVKAVSPKKNGGGVVYDLTAGFGQDALTLAQNGASKVVMVERDPIVAMLLEDALRRLSLTTMALVDRLSLIVGDGPTIVERARCDVCYLDPMFPPRTKSAAVKKNMQILHGLLGSQNAATSLSSEAALLEAACRAAKHRVVVKRPIHSPVLGGVGYTKRKPSYDIRGKGNRWDIYLPG